MHFKTVSGELSEGQQTVSLCPTHVTARAAIGLQCERHFVFAATDDL